VSVDLERIKKLAGDDLLVAAVEIPTKPASATLIADDLEEVLSNFDNDADYAHFVVRVKRSTLPLPKPNNEPQPPQLSIDSMVNETFELMEQLSNERERAPQTAEKPNDPTSEYEPSFLLENAKILEESGDLPLARNIYNALIRKGLLIPQGLSGMARCYEKEGQTDRAIRCYREAIAYSSELSFYQALAAIFIRLGNDQEASDTIVHALGLPNLKDAEQFELHKSAGNCFTRLADFKKAEHHYRKAYELNAESDALQVNVGSLALQKGDHEAAKKHFQKALDLNPNNDKAISGLGMIAMDRQNLAKAHDYFASSLKVNLNNLGAIYNLVKCAYELKKFEEAAQLLKKYIETNPVNTNILYSYAGILYHQEEYRLALSEVKKILESNPGHSGARELLDLISAKVNKTN
jgi:tetratricopeptide (TPR) repeat protein